MKLIKLILLFLCMIYTFLYPQKNISILERSDKAYFPSLAKFNVVMELYENNKYDKFYEIECYLKGSRKYLALFKNPPIVRRRAQLRLEDKIWIYLGKINRTMEVSVKASFAESTFSEEDILSASLGHYYDLEKVEEIELDGQIVLKLSLISPTQNTAYYRIESFINKETLLPIKRYYYSFSNQKIKELDVKEIKKVSGKLNYLHLVMYDALRKDVYTEIKMKDFEYPNDLDDRLFTKRYMEIACE